MDSEEEALNTTLRSRDMRNVYLITYSQVNVEICLTRESFVNIVQGAFTACYIHIVQWVCAQEHHQNAGIHYHLAVKLSERQRWIRVRSVLQERHGVWVNFSKST